MEKLILGVLASGRGSNFQAILDAIDAGTLNATVKLLIVDNAEAPAIERARKKSIEYLHIDRRRFSTRDDFFVKIADEFRSRRVELVILAGFMRIVGKPLIEAFPSRIMNIHPALLPSFPGLHGQSQATDYGVRISGCTVHFVDEGMDTGPIIIQAAVAVSPDDTEDALSKRILELEHKIYPEAIRLYAEGRLKLIGRKVLIEGYTFTDGYIVNPLLR